MSGNSHFLNQNVTLQYAYIAVLRIITNGAVVITVASQQNDT